MTKARYIGTNWTSSAQWRIASNVTVFAEYVREVAGADVGVIQIDSQFLNEICKTKHGES